MRAGTTSKGPATESAAPRCCRYPATRTGNGTGREVPAARQPDRLHGAWAVCRTAARDHRAGPVGVSDPVGLGHPRRGDGAREAGGRHLPDPCPADGGGQGLIWRRSGADRGGSGGGQPSPPPPPPPPGPLLPPPPPPRPPLSS